MLPRRALRPHSLLAGALLLGTGLAAAHPPLPAQAAEAPSLVVEAVGGPVPYVVGADVTALRIEMKGGDGGVDGGRGGLVTGLLPVTPGQTLHLVVGGQGGGYDRDDPAAPHPDRFPGGVNGGGPGGGGASSLRQSGGGGGATDIRTSPDDPSSRLMVAGGGGGGGGGQDAYLAGIGGDAGAPGSACRAGSRAEPGTETIGGAMALCTSTHGTDGDFGVGGAGGGSARTVDGIAGGGGGGGWYGGGGGSGGRYSGGQRFFPSSGAGGSNHVDASVTDSTSGVSPGTESRRDGYIAVTAVRSPAPPSGPPGATAPPIPPAPPVPTPTSPPTAAPRPQPSVPPWLESLVRQYHPALRHWWQGRS